MSARDDDSFFRLSPDRVLDAVEAAGLRPTGHCTALNALENRVYDLRLEGGHHVVAKFYRPGRWSREEILEEHRMLFALRDAEIPVCAPLTGPDGETVREALGIHYALWPRTGGRAPDELSDDEVAVLGRLLARIHAAGKSLGPVHRPKLDAESVPLTALALLEERGFLPPSCARAYAELTREIARLYTELAEGIALQPIHGDCHVGNLLRGDEGFFFLDFDDLVVGPPVQDVWMLLPGRDTHAQRQRELLVDAYETFLPFDRRSLALVEPLRAFRFVHYAGWIAKRWDDPSFPDAFPHFGSEAYWEEETRDLAEQLERIRNGREPAASPDGASTGSPEEVELTNEDFFWDL